MQIRSLAFAAASIASLILVPVGAASAENGVTADTIVFGQAAVLTGPAAALGQGMKTGMNAAFDEINKKGGVRGRKLKLISADDGYEDVVTATHVKRPCADE